MPRPDFSALVLSTRMKSCEELSTAAKVRLRIEEAILAVWVLVARFSRISQQRVAIFLPT
jgi:hypothetical protein